MSDSFNSPNHLSLETSQESSPEPNVPAVDAQAAVSTSDLEDFENDFEDLEAIASSDSESDFEEEVSFEVIASYIEAEVEATTAASFESNADAMAVESETEEAPSEAASNLSEASIVETAEDDLADVGSEEEGELSEFSAAPTENIVTLEAEETSAASRDDSSESTVEIHEVSLSSLDGEDVEIEIEDSEAEITEPFNASVEVVDVEILESQEQERSYEVHQDGTLTYFQYFLDEEDAATGAGYGDWRNESNSSPRSFVSATAVGVGALAAIFGAGLLVAEATNNNSSISDNKTEGSETQAKADAERKASEASELAQASSPETTMPDWSATQKAIAVSQSSAQANPELGSAAAMLQSKLRPATSSVTSKLAPLSQSWGASVPLPYASLPVASRPVVTTASLPTPTTVPVELSSLQPVPSYQVIQPSRSTASSLPLPSPPAREVFQPDEQQLKARMAALRERMADPIASSTVPVTTDGNLLDGPDDR